MVFIIISRGILMKINRHNLLYQDKKNWKNKIATLKAFKIPYEAEIRECAMEHINLVSDYNSSPAMRIRGVDVDWFLKLYSIKYKTKLRILPA